MGLYISSAPTVDGRKNLVCEKPGDVGLYISICDIVGGEYDRPLLGDMTLYAPLYCGDVGGEYDGLDGEGDAIGLLLKSHQLVPVLGCKYSTGGEYETWPGDRTSGEYDGLASALSQFMLGDMAGMDAGGGDK